MRNTELLNVKRIRRCVFIFFTHHNSFFSIESAFLYALVLVQFL